MGRRSINTTKSGKYMNPTDQASKSPTKNFTMFNFEHVNMHFVICALLLC